MRNEQRIRWLVQHLWELVLMALALAVLQQLAARLDLTVALAHLTERYGKPLDSQNMRTLLLNATAGVQLSLLAVATWSALLIGRLPISLISRLALILAIWVMAADSLRPFGANIPWQIAMVLASLSWVTRRLGDARFVVEPQETDSLWHFPAFFLLTGIGLLWLTDYGARSYVKFQYIGLMHADTLFVGYMLLTLFAASQYRALAFISRVLSRKHAEIWAWVGLIAWCCALGSVSEFGVFGKEFIDLTGIKLKPALTTELLRAPVFVAAGWVTYRWVGTRERSGLGLAQLAACGLVWVLGQALARDHGPILIFAAASGLVMGGLAGWGLARSLGAAAVFPGFALTIGATWALHRVLIEFGPRVSHTIASRIAALDAAQQTQSQFLSELQWFLASTPLEGHGLGTTPWCGDWAWFANCTQGLHAGVPQQTQSDYVFVALSGVFGAVGAVAITALLGAWLVALIAARDEPGSWGAQVVSVSRLRDSIVAVFAVVTLMQLAVTVFGSLGVIPLAGVAFPLVGYGRTAFFVTCAFLGLAMNRSVQPLPTNPK